MSSLLPPPLYLRRKCPPWTAAEVSALRLNWEKEKRRVVLACPCLFPLTRGTDWESGTEWADCLYVWSFSACIHMWGGTVFEKGENRSLSVFGRGYERGKVERRAEVGWWRANFIFWFDIGFSFLFHHFLFDVVCASSHRGATDPFVQLGPVELLLFRL